MTVYHFDWSSIPGALPFLLQGMALTLEITLVAVAAGIAWGTLLAVASRSSRSSSTRSASVCFAASASRAETSAASARPRSRATCPLSSCARRSS